ncbi:MAG: hypothetical protein WDN25_13140 [Acetobacteraceae bacterium]
MSQARTVVFDRPGQVARLVMRDGERFVLLERGEQPKVMPITEGGEYEIDFQELCPNAVTYPMALMAIEANRAILRMGA